MGSAGTWRRPIVALLLMALLVTTLFVMQQIQLDTMGRAAAQHATLDEARGQMELAVGVIERRVADPDDGQASPATQQDQARLDAAMRTLESHVRVLLDGDLPNGSVALQREAARAADGGDGAPSLQDAHATFVARMASVARSEGLATPWAPSSDAEDDTEGTGDEDTGGEGTGAEGPTGSDDGTGGPEADGTNDGASYARLLEARDELADAMTRVDEALEAQERDSARQARHVMLGSFTATIVALFLVGALVFAPLVERVRAARTELDTSRREMEARVQRRTEQLEKRTRELERSTQELQQLTAATAHDLQEPLRIITSYTQLIEQRLGNELDETTREYLAFTVAGSARMKRLLNDLLAYAQVGSRGHELATSSLEVAVAEAEADLETRIRRSNTTIEMHPLPPVHGHPDELRTLFVELIQNAITYARESAPPHIVIRGRVDADGVHVLVRDHGIGIEAPYRERVFRLFQRLGERTDVSGTGIGLATVRKIMDHHDGQVRIEDPDTEGPGTQFHLVFRPPVPELPSHPVRRHRSLEEEADDRRRELL